ncbi:MAG: quinone-dependent dihydroorotate dehydrogenase [Bacteroidia bacterium]
MYKILLKPLFFLFDPEKIHHFTFAFLKFFLGAGFIRKLVSGIYGVKDERLKRSFFGLEFSNPVGLGAGFDKNALLFDELSAFGFGFIEVGTLTPKGQPGNEKPRLFRLPADEALINRMGFNNDGVDSAALRLQKKKVKGLIIGGNIGKNKLTPNEEAFRDYEYCFSALYEVVDYFVVNVSSPNTPNLRELQDKEPLTALLNHIMALNRSKPVPRPVLLKIAPDLGNEQLDDIIGIVKETGIDGIIATNTTISREGLKTPASEVEKCGAGGLSGKPVAKRSTEVIRYLSQRSGKAFPIIAVGGIHTPEDALEKLAAGADLLQVYTGFIYEGPGMVKKINKAIVKVASAPLSHRD